MPGQHGRSRSKLSDYGLQLREKQKVKRIYGLFEKQFRFYFQRAAKSRGITGHVLLQLLERRLDNVVFKLRFASSLAQARQMVCHGLIFVNDRKVDISSYHVKPNDEIKVKTDEAGIKLLKEILEITKERALPSWLNLDQLQLKGFVTKLPERDDIQFPIKEQLIVELYSK